MQREVSDRNILDTFCEEFCSLVEVFCRYIVVSGFVAISSGRARGTEDIDIILERVPEKTFFSLFSALAGAGFSCIQTGDASMAFAYLMENESLRFCKKNRPLPEMEVKFARDDLDAYQMRTRTKLALTGLDVWFSNVNVNIAFKEELLKSPKDIEDAQHLRLVYSELVDEREIQHVKKLIRECRL